MSSDVKWLLIIALVAFVIGRAFFRRKTKVFEPEGEDDPLIPAVRVRLSELQQVALCSASSFPIRVENSRLEPLSPSQEHYPKRTVESLVKRGFLEPDGEGRYAITQAGLVAMGWSL